MADDPNPHGAPISTEFQSLHVQNLKVALETLDVNDEQANVNVEIKLSKEHWSELASSYYTAGEGPTMDSSSTSLLKWVNEEGTPEWKLEVVEDNMRVFRSLQEKYPSGFFIDENDLGPDSTQQLAKWMLNDDGTSVYLEIGLSSEIPFAEGGQAQLFHAHHKNRYGKKCEALVMKVFKEGTPLKDLLKSFPITMLTNDSTCIEGEFGRDIPNCNRIRGARLMKSTRRFAFLMQRAWGDLRKLMNKRMLYFNNQDPPFPNGVAFYIIHEIAKGMNGLHKRNIVHRDLKAANVLVFECFGKKHSIIDPLNLQPHGFHCWIADFECSVGVVGTGFWRAPEILEAVKNRNISQKPELFTKQADVYSFGMTCYEILSGSMLLEELQTNNYDDVIGGTRPMLPNQTPPWMVDLVNRCWNKDPSKRPQFGEIVEILERHIYKKKKKKLKWKTLKNYISHYFQF